MLLPVHAASAEGEAEAERGSLLSRIRCMGGMFLTLVEEEGAINAPDLASLVAALEDGGAWESPPPDVPLALLRAQVQLLVRKLQDACQD